MKYNIVSVKDSIPVSNGTPQWAIDLVKEIKASANMEHRPLELVWKNADRNGSSGRTHWNKVEWQANRRAIGYKITINAGTDPIDQRHVVLHEMAHWLINETHTDRFWILAFQLYNMYMPTYIEVCKEREGNYKKRSAIGYAAISRSK